MQDVYLDAYRHIDDFRGAAPLATRLTRIVINQALMRLRRRVADENESPYECTRHPTMKATLRVK